MHRLKTASWIFDVGIRRMNANQEAGWAVQMGVFGALFLTLMAAVVFGLRLDRPLVVIGAVDLVATLYFVRWSLRRIRMLGIFGPTRARWWIEVAALDWTLCMSTGLFAITQGVPAGAMPAWQQALVDFSLNCAVHLFPLFFALTVVAYVLGVIQGRLIRGRALELVNWFFWWIVVCVPSTWLIPDDPALANFVAPALGILSVVILCVAGLLALRQWAQQRTAGRCPSGPS